MANCYQLIYTTCQRGISKAGTGFQIYSYSKDIPEAYKDVNEGVRKTCSYKVPNVELATPGIPTPQEIEELYPIRYAYNCMDANNYFVARSKYIGLDNVKTRYGNFISHVMALEEVDHYPISAVYSSMFRDCLEEHEMNSDDIPPYLDVVSGETLFEDDTRILDDINDFLSDDPNRPAYLSLMISAVFDYFKNDKRIIICDTPENVVMWIAAITKAFPLYIAKEITFTTYAFNPLEADSMICGVMKEGTAYSVQMAQQYGIFNIFDFENNVFSEDYQQVSFGDIVENGLTVNYSILADYHDFMEKFGYDIKNGYADELYSAYNLFRGNLGGYNGSQLADIFQYVLDYGRVEFQAAFVEEAMSAFNESYELDVDTIFTFLKLGFSFAENAGDTAMQKKMSLIYWRKMLNLVNDSDQVGTDKIKVLQHNVMTMFAKSKNCIYNALLSNQVVNMVVESIHQDVILYHNSFWMGQLLQFMNEAKISLRGYAEKYNSDILREIYLNVGAMSQPANAVENVVREDIAVALAYETYKTFMDMFKGQPDIYGEIAKNLYARLQKNNEYDTIWEYMDSLQDENMYELKYEMARFCAQNANLPCEKVLEFQKKCIAEKSGFAEEYLDSFARFYLFQMAPAKYSVEDKNHYITENLALLSDRSTIDEFVREYEKTLEIQKKPDMNALTAFVKGLSTVDENYRKSKSYLVYTMYKKVFITDNGNPNVAPFERCSFEMLNDNDCVFVLQKIVKMFADQTFTDAHHREIMRVLETMHHNKWKLYPQILLELDDKQSAMVDSYFTYIFRDHIVDGRRELFNIFITYPLRKVEKFKEQNVYYFNGTNADVSKDFQGFIEDVEDYIQNNKKGIGDVVKSIFKRKG